MSNEQANLNEDAKPTTDETAGLPEQLPTEGDANKDVAAEIVEATDQEIATADAFAVDVAIDMAEAKRALEAVLLAASEPMPLQELKKIFDGALTVEVIRESLDELREEWSGRSVELALVASGYRFRIKPDYQKYLDRLSNDKPPRYSRAVLETLAIIAYRQPVTRADIEDIRGVAVSPHILKTLEDRGWIDEIGHKDAPGRPALFATTRHFLDDLNLLSLEQLPPLHELQATLDMSQAGVVSGGETPSLPGVAEHDDAQDAPHKTTQNFAQVDGHEGVEQVVDDVDLEVDTKTDTDKLELDATDGNANAASTNAANPADENLDAPATTNTTTNPKNHDRNGVSS